jgi:hypothetical protein
MLWQAAVLRKAGLDWGNAIAIAIIASVIVALLIWRYRQPVLAIAL